MRIHGGEAPRPRARRCSTLLALGGLAALLHAGPALAATPLPGDIAFASKAPAPGQTGQGRSRINVMNTDGVGVALTRILPAPMTTWIRRGRRTAGGSRSRATATATTTSTS